MKFMRSIYHPNEPKPMWRDHDVCNEGCNENHMCRIHIPQISARSSTCKLASQWLHVLLRPHPFHHSVRLHPSFEHHFEIVFWTSAFPRFFCCSADRARPFPSPIACSCTALDVRCARAFCPAVWQRPHCAGSCRCFVRFYPGIYWFSASNC